LCSLFTNHLSIYPLKNYFNYFFQKPCDINTYEGYTVQENISKAQILLLAEENSETDSTLCVSADT
jgi:hypothetical protein